MENNPLSPAQVLVVTNIEFLIMNLDNDPERLFADIIRLTDNHNLAENEDIMKYLYELIGGKGYIEYAEEFAKRYNIQSEIS